MSEQNTADRPMHRNRHMLFIYLISLLLIATATVLVLFFLKSKNKKIYPSITSFKSYYAVDKNSTTTLETTSISYTSDVLLYKLKHLQSGKELTVTEQKIPNGFDTSSLKGDEEFTLATGKVYITDGQSRTTAALFTNDGTWILINAPDPIGADEMKLVLESLAPLEK